MKGYKVTDLGFRLRVVKAEEKEEEKCQVHAVPVSQWFYSAYAKGELCPECIKAGFFIKPIVDDYERSQNG